MSNVSKGPAMSNPTKTHNEITELRMEEIEAMNQLLESEIDPYLIKALAPFLDAMTPDVDEPMQYAVFYKMLRPELRFIYDKMMVQAMLDCVSVATSFDDWSGPVALALMEASHDMDIPFEKSDILTIMQNAANDVLGAASRKSPATDACVTPRWEDVFDACCPLFDALLSKCYTDFEVKLASEGLVFGIPLNIWIEKAALDATLLITSAKSKTKLNLVPLFVNAASKLTADCIKSARDRADDFSPTAHSA